MRGTEDLRIDTGEALISATRLGSGPAVLLLHGFPQTKLMWRDIAPRLAERFTVICADLRGYGDSSTPPSDAEHAAYSKRAMARDMISVMAQLGFTRFGIAGHDRGGRVAYRTALDHPGRVDALAVLDVLPVDAVWDRADDRLALGFWPWSLLAQPEPLPERLIAGAPDAVTGSAFSGAWGSPAGTFGEQVRAAYTAALSDPARIHAICEEYRAAAGIDRDHDAADRAAGRMGGVGRPTGGGGMGVERGGAESAGEGGGGGGGWRGIVGGGSGEGARDGGAGRGGGRGEGGGGTVGGWGGGGGGAVGGRGVWGVGRGGGEDHAGFVLDAYGYTGDLTAIRDAIIGRVERNVAVIRQLADGGEPTFQRMLPWAADLERSGSEVAELPDEFWQRPGR